MASPSDPEVCIEWRKAMQMAVGLVPKVILNPGGPVFRNYWIKVWAQFNWKTKTQYHFAEFKEAISPFEPMRIRCVYLFKAPFRWGKFTAFHPDPINTYTRFRGIPLLEDGTPDVTFSHNWWTWTFPPDPRFYTHEEWKIVMDWEEKVFYYNHAQRRCVAWYEWLGVTVAQIETKRPVIVKDVLLPKRRKEMWDKGTEAEKIGVQKKYWMKWMPLRYVIELPDKTTYETTRKGFTEF